MTDLSPATQAVVTAIEKFDWEAGHFSREEIWFCSREVVAAALRAAADQVVPEDYSSYTGHPEHDFAMEARNDSAREAILAIAAELEAQ